MKRPEILTTPFCVVVAVIASLGSGSAASAMAGERWGRLDASFGDGGRVLTDFGADEFVHALALQRDGKILAAGGTRVMDVAAAKTVTLSRYLPDGSLDPSFATGGVHHGPPGEAVAVFARRDGTILVVGTLLTAFDSWPRSGYGIVVARYRPDGRLDASFGGGDGWVLFDRIEGRTAPPRPYAPGDHIYATDAAIQRDGNVVIVGGIATAARNALTRSALVMRLVPEGTLDTTFAGDGATLFAVAACTTASTVAIGGDNRIVVAGRTGACGSDVYTVDERFIARMDAGGAFDTSFGAGRTGITRVRWRTQESDRTEPNVEALVLDRRGRAVLAGTTHRSHAFGILELVTVMRFTRGGARDRSFGGDGRIVDRLGRRDIRGSRAMSVAMAPGGRIAVAGWSDPYEPFTTGASPAMLVAVYRPDGRRDRDFGRGGLRRVEYPGLSGPGGPPANGAADAILVDRVGRIVVGGAFAHNGLSFALARFTAR